ncbi:Cbp1p LALA0_S11e02982g [Lachancea lanzarotensis]|uniref:LALA0S11e02982g1_1 n=1 Tax=Lachancea lanzarotensis TaxID=1245769 RepID=A0A0C7NF96_9SACH|nr:uncharacterized protein LALA0_S11e02982g [Lachancea lanzarotensis]CEP64389.1 LALA0S11e02982g1_1 [Lachancea lanzarotensis]
MHHVLKASPNLNLKIGIRICRRTKTILTTYEPSNKTKIPKEVDNFNKSIQKHGKKSREVKSSVPSKTPHLHTNLNLNPTKHRKNRYENSSSYRAFVRWEVLRQNSKPNDAIHSFNFLRGQINLAIKDNIENNAYLIDLLIADALEYYDITNAVDLFIWFYANSKQTPPSTQLADKIMGGLAFSNPMHDEKLLTKFLQLMEFMLKKIPSYELSEYHATQICAKAMSVVNNPLLIKKVLDHVYEIPYTNSNTLRNAQVLAAYRLINEDYKKANPSGVFYQWTAIKNHYTSLDKHDSRILYRVIKLFTNQKSYRFRCKEILTKLEPDFYVNNPLLLPCFVIFSVKTNDFKLATKIMSDITSYATTTTKTTNLNSKFMLSTLLRLHLNFKDSSGVQNVLNTIQKNTTGLSPADYQAIVSHLMTTGKEPDLDKAITITTTIKGISALPSAVAIINHVASAHFMQNHSTKAYSTLETILRFADNIDKKHRNKLWDILASIFVNSLTSYGKFGKNQKEGIILQEAKQKAKKNTEFLRFLYLNSLTKMEHESTADPFNMTSPKDIILKLTKSNKLVILRTIAKEARFANRIDLLRWCISEMIKCGMPMKEIELDWNTMEKHQVRRYAFTNIKCLSKNVDNHGIKNFKNVIN